MQTSYQLRSAKALKGQPLTVSRKSRPMMIPLLAQISTLTVTAGALTADLVLTVVDDATQQSYSITVTGSANEATLGASLLAAVRANGKLNQLFSVANTTAVDASNLVTVFTARHANRTYTLSATGGPSATAPAFATTQAAGGSGIAFGSLVAKSTGGDDEIEAIGASTTVDQIVGLLFRTDANHFHKLENELFTDVDLALRGVHFAIGEDIRCWVQVEDAVTPASRPYVRRALTSGAGSVGDGFRGTPAGSAQVLTVTPIVNQAIYGFSFTFGGQELEAVYMPTDATTSIADACAGLLDAINAEITAKGLTGSLTAADNTTTLTVTSLAGTGMSEPSANVWYNDTEVATVTATLGTEDVDTIDISKIARFETTASAGGLVVMRFKVDPFQL